MTARGGALQTYEATKNSSHDSYPTPRLVVIQDGDNAYIEEAVPVKCPVRHGLGAVGFTDNHTPTARQVMPAAELFDAVASVCGLPQASS